MSKPKKCPLHITPCDQEECALWLDTTNECSYVTAARALKTLANEITALVKPIKRALEEYKKSNIRKRGGMG